METTLNIDRDFVGLDLDPEIDDLERLLGPDLETVSRRRSVPVRPRTGWKLWLREWKRIGEQHVMSATFVSRPVVAMPPMPSVYQNITCEIALSKRIVALMDKVGGHLREELIFVGNVSTFMWKPDFIKADVSRALRHGDDEDEIEIALYRENGSETVELFCGLLRDLRTGVQINPEWEQPTHSGKIFLGACPVFVAAILPATTARRIRDDGVRIRVRVASRAHLRSLLGYKP